MDGVIAAVALALVALPRFLSLLHIDYFPHLPILIVRIPAYSAAAPLSFPRLAQATRPEPRERPP